MNIKKIKTLTSCLENLSQVKFRQHPSYTTRIVIEDISTPSNECAAEITQALNEAIYIVLARYESELREQLTRCAYEPAKAKDTK